MLDRPENQPGNTGTAVAREQREYLADYCISPAGRVPWQDDYIDRHPS